MNNEEFQVVLLEKMRCMAVETPEKRLLGDAEYMRGLSAAEVWELTGRVYGLLKARGIGREDFVLVRLPRGVQPYVVMVGVWRAGAACIVIEEEEAPERTEFIRRDCAAKLVADRAFYEAAMRTAPRDGWEPVAPHDAAFAVYTSGTTGTPKGALHEYGQLNRISASHTPPSYRGRPQQMFGYIGLLNFIGTELAFTLWVSNGVGHHVVPREIVRNPSAFDAYCDEAGIDCAFLPPSYVRLAGDRLRHLRSAVVSSEPIDGLVSDWMQFINFYVMSESAFVVMTKVFEPGEVCTSGGKPELPLDLRVLDEEGRSVPQGELGEICYDNPFLRGYIGRPEETEKAFRFGLYHTGDLGRFDANGELFVAGRMTDMVKINGNRVEPGEIEGVARRLLKNENVACRVVSNGDTHLVCLYYIGQDEVDAEKIRADMAKYLPYYMIPAAFVRMDAFPKTRTGKIDRKALPTPDFRSDIAIVLPSTDFEKKAFPVVAAELGTEDFGVLTNLVSLGLTSLRAIRLSYALEQTTGRTVSVSDMLSHPRLCDWEAFAVETAQRLAGLVAKDASVPLSANQLGLYIDWTKAPQGLQYNLPFALRFDGVSGETLREAVYKVVKTHPVLTARIADRDGTVSLVRRDDLELPISFEAFDREPDAAFFQSRVKPFDLLKDDLARFEVYASPKAAFLFLDIHHIIFDGGSFNILLSDLKAVLGGAKTSSEIVSAFDFAIYDENWLSSSAAEEASAYFDTLVAGTESLVYPSVRGNATETGEAASCSARIPLAPIRSRCRALGVTENSFFATVLCHALRQLTWNDEIQIATISSGRSFSSLARTVGMFVQTLPLVDRQSKATVGEALQAMQDQVASTLRRDRYPYTRLVERHGLRPNVLYAYQGDVIDGNLMPSGVTSVPLTPSQTQVPVSVEVMPAGEFYSLQIEYDAGLYADGEMDSLLAALGAAAVAMAEIPIESPLGEVPLVSQTDAEELLALGFGGRLDYDESETFVDQFLRSARAWPDARAVVAENGSLTYRELDECSDVLAAALVARGVKPNDFVAIKLPRVKEFMVAVLGVMKAGGAYVPVDPEYPEDRIAYMLADSGAKVVVDEAFLVEVEKVGGCGQWRGSSFFNIQPSTFNLARPEGLAYMIYTSGSTGKPKGVMISHRSLRANLAWLAVKTGVRRGDRICCYNSFSFDASIGDLYHPLAAGAELHILSAALRLDLVGMDAYFRENRIKGVDIISSVALELMNNFDLSLDYLNVGGEKIVPFRPNPKIRVYNGYGPTEFTNEVAYGLIDQTFPHASIPLGRPVPNLTCAIVSSSGQLLPRGVAGELCFLGRQMSRGYWRRPELTAEKFVTLPWQRGWRLEVGGGQRRDSSASTSNLNLQPSTSNLSYRSGDLARWNEAGEIEFLGRIDQQVKLRGFRVEMGEIEAAVAAVPGVARAVVDVKEIGGAKHLVAYYMTDADIAGETIREAVSRTLTSYMVPDAFVRLEALPTLPNGKVDRKALPLPEIKGAVYVAPEGATEIAVAAAMADVLNLTNPVGRDDDFLSLGGDSIRSIRLVSKLRAVGVTVTVADILKEKTVKGVAALAKATTTFAADQSDWSGEVPLTAVQAWFLHERNLAKPEHFNQSQMVTASERLDIDLLHQALDALARHHDMLRAVYEGDVQRVRATEGEGALCDLIVVDGDDRDVVKQNGDRVQSSFDLAKGPLFKAILFRGRKADHILLVIHHLVVDGVSWRILLEDLGTAYGQLKAGAAVRLPPKTMSFLDWRSAVGRYAESFSLRRELDYWRGVDAQVSAMPARKSRGVEMRGILRTLAAEPFAALTGKASAAYHTEANDLLLTALGRAYAKVTGENSLSVELEGHGREPINEETQIDRTVGWFTSSYPVVIETRADMRASIRGVKERLRRVPNHGLGYGILRFVSQALSQGDAPEPTMTFNYLGTFAEGGEKGLFSIDDSLPKGREVSAKNVCGPAMSVDCWGTAEGALAIACGYDASCWTDADAAMFADAFVSELEAVVAHTFAVETSERTASDCGETTWTDAEFQSVDAEFSACGEKLERIYPLTSMQEGMLLKALAEPNSSAYHITTRVGLGCLPTEAQFAAALEKLLAKHEVLRTAVVHRGVCEPRQAIVSGRKIPVSFVDLSGERDPESAAASLDRREFDRPIDLQHDPLFRLIVAKTAEASCHVVFVMHHIIVDGWCTRLWLGDFMAFLEESVGGTLEAEDFSSRAGRYERHVRDLASRDRDAALGYWRGLLDGYESKAEVPAFEKVTDANRATSNVLTFELPAEETARLAEICREAGCTVNNAVEAAWGLLLQKYNRTDDAVFVKVVSGRDHAVEDVADIVGPFINSVPVRVRTEKDATLLDLVKAQQRQAGETSANDWVPLSDIQAQTALGGELFQSILAFENFEIGEVSRLAPSVGMRVVSDLETNVSEIVIAANVSADRLAVGIDFDVDKYDRRTMERLARAFEHLLSRFAEEPQTKAASVPLVSAADAAALIALGSGEKLDYDRTETLVDLFRRKAKENLAATAVVAVNGTLTYAELDAQSDALAAALVAKGVRRDDFVVVKLGRVKEFPLTILAIWKAGAAYVPVDPEYPEDRIRFMIEDSGARVVVDEAVLCEVEKVGEPSTFNLAKPTGLAYMIYTSGSTGMPKGVMVTHANLLAFTQWALKVTEAKPGDALAHFSSFSFDASLDDLVAMFGSGATLHILDEATRRDMTAFHDYLVKHKIAVMDLPAAYAMTLLNTFDDVPLRCLSTGGEKLLPTRYLPKRFINGYGPTEFTVCSSIHDVNPEEDGDDIPIGRPVPNTLSAIVDADGNLLPRGMVGELVLAGEQLTKGYWKRPELTAERFVTLPWQRESKCEVEERMVSTSSTSNLNLQPPTFNLSYRTGDLARWNEAGELLYCGRIDSQIKLRGFRIELGEIETVMAKFPGVAAAVADVKKTNGVERLVGYYVVADDVDEAALRAELAKTLTEYMVPDVFVRLERIPMTPVGKVDRKALPMPEIKAEKIVAPETDSERSLFDVVAAELKTSDFGVMTNLISLGLTSLRAIRLSAVIRRDTGLVVSTGDILAKPRIRDWVSLASTADETIPVLPPRETYPLTANQLGIYVEWERDRAGLQYNVTNVLRFRNVDAAKLHAAVSATVAAHPSFKIRFEERDGEIVQVRRDGAEIPIRLERLDVAPDAAFFAGLIRPFDLLKDDLARFAVYGHGGDAWLFCDIHHTIFDGSSSDVLLTAVCEVLAGRTLPKEQVTAFDYALFLADWQRSKGHDEAMKHYRELLSGTESFKYPSRHVDTAPSVRAAHRVFRIARPDIRSRCRAVGVTENAFFATAFCQVFHRAGRTDVVQIATISGGRSRTQLAETVGMFVQTLPLVSRMPKGCVSDVLKAMHEQIAATLRNDLVSYAELSSEFHLEPDVMYVYQDGVEGGEAALPAGVESVQAYAQDAVQRGLTVGVSPSGDAYEIHLDFDAGLYGEEEMAALEHAVAAFAQNLAAVPDDADVSSVPLVTEAEARELVTLGMGERIDYDDGETFLDLFCRQVRERPEAMAVIASNGTFTYGELDAASDALAAALAAKGVRAGDFVAVKLGRMKEFPASVIAAWKVGAAYVPVDPAAAPDRVSYMLEDSGARVVVDEAFVEKVKVEGQGQERNESKCEAEERIASTSSTSTSSSTSSSTSNLNLQPPTINLARPDGLAYMIYTSGSTGKPKGVMVSHRALRAFIAWRCRLTGSKPGDCDGINASFSFDASMDIYATLSSGACAYVFDDILKPDLDRILAQVREHNIRVMGMNTSLGVAFLDNYDVPLDLLTLGGEALTPFRPCRTRVANCYGPTEFTVASVIGIVDQSFPDGTNISIGRPVPNSIAAVVDAYGNLVPRGMTGELCSAGTQIAAGYWKRPELTAEKFVTLPWQRESTCEVEPPSPRLPRSGVEERRDSSSSTFNLQPSTFNLSYRTGDLACWTVRGELLYLGRMDAQVKFRGYRIELGEIEANMLSFPGIREAAVCVKRVGVADRLCGYYVTGVAIDETALRAALAKALSDYMVPDCFVRLEAMPRNLSGKVDHRALPIPVLAAEAVVAPETDFEKRAFAVVATELGDANFGVTTNLISLGLTSISAIRVSVALRKATGREIRIGDILAKPRIRDWDETRAVTEEIPVLPPQETYPLMQNQREIFACWERHPKWTHYNLPTALRFAGVDAARLRDAVEKAIAAHPYLKVHFGKRGNEVVQVRRDAAELPVLFARLESAPDAALFQSRIRPFDLLHDDLARFEVYGFGEDAYLFYDVHHIVFDGGSVNAFQTDVLRAYAGEKLQCERVTAYDYALAQRDWLKTAAHEEAARYFDSLVVGTEPLFYPPARVGAVPTGQVGLLLADMPRVAVAARCRALGVTENAFLATAFCEALRRLLHVDDLQIATSANGRSLTQLAGAVGMFVQTLPLVSRRREGSVAEAVRAMQEQIAESVGHDRCPQAEPERHGCAGARIIYEYQGGLLDFPEGCPRMSNVPLTLDAVKGPLYVDIFPSGETYALSFEFDAGLYDEDEIRTLQRTFCEVAADFTS